MTKHWTFSLLVAAGLVLPLRTATAQHDHGGMGMADKVLLLAQLDGQQVVPATTSKATATGAFQLDPRHRSLEYRLTYQGLEGGAPQLIALYNFGRGKDGERVAVLCGDTADNACPQRDSATISGQIKK